MAEEQHSIEWPDARLCPNCKNHAQVTWARLFFWWPSSFGSYDLRAMEQQWFDFHLAIGSSQEWIATNPNVTIKELNKTAQQVMVIGRCLLCKQVSAHSLDGALLWPRESEIAPANPDMPEDIREHYNEARLISEQSPRAAITLLRYCIQKLLRDGGYNGTLRSQIAALSRDGGSRRLKRALEAVQLVGNSAAHEDEIAWDVQDVETLFTLVNLVGDEFYSKDAVVENAHLEIQKRRGNNKGA